MAEPRSTPEQRAALRERYTPDAVQTCGDCHHMMHLIGQDGYAREYVCSNQECLTRRVIPAAQWLIIAAVDDADAMAGALAEIERLERQLLAHRVAVGVCRREYSRMRDALQTIRDNYGQVCDEYETCTHRACTASYGAWAVADAALAGPAPGSAQNAPLDGLQGSAAREAGKDGGMGVVGQSNGIVAKGENDGR